MKALFIIILTLLSVAMIAQPALSFQRCYGGTGDEYANRMFDCNGNGFLVIGETTSNDGDVSGNHGGRDIWVFRNDSTGAILWQKCFGGSADEWLTGVYPTNDGGYMILSITSSNDGDVVGNIGGTDFWVFKIDSLGNILWQNSIGGSQDEPYYGGWSTYRVYFNASTQSLSIYFCSMSNDGDMTASLGNQDIWNVTINSAGNTIIQNSNSTTGEDELIDIWDFFGTLKLVCIIDQYLTIGSTTYPVIGYSDWGGRTTDGGYLVYWEDTWGPDPYIVKKYNSTGAFQGDFGVGYLSCGHEYSGGQSYTYITNTGFIVHYEVNYVGCFNPNPPAYYTYTTEISNSGTVITSCGTEELTWGGIPMGNITTSGICPSPQGGGGSNPTFDFALEGGIIRFFSAAGQIQAEKRTVTNITEWTKSIGGTGYEYFNSYIQRSDTSYWVLGGTYSNDIDVSGNHGGYDIWLTSLSPAKNWASGYVWEDVNGNGTIDASDPPASNLLLQAQTSAGNIAYAISQANGKYELKVAVGNLVISAPNPPVYHTLIPGTDTVSFSSNDGSVDSLHNFLLYTIPNMQDLRITLTVYTSPQQGANRQYDLTYKNVGTQSSGATIRYNFTGLESFVVASPAPDTLTASYASWNVTNLIPAASGSISLVMHTNIAGTGMVTSTAAIYPFTNDQNLADNTDAVSASIAVVGLPYDPNDKLVSPKGNPNLDDFLANEKYLTYTIRFQNTGTAPATKVVLKDTLSLLLDITTLEILSASHDFVATIEGSNKLVITYNNIMLPDSGVDYLGSQGFIKFRIKPQAPISYCEPIWNRSAIYFDFNAPVITNQLRTMFLPDAPTLTYIIPDTVCNGQQFVLTCSPPAANFQNTWASNGGSFSPFNVGGSITDNKVYYLANTLGNNQITFTQSISNVFGCTLSAPPIQFLVAQNPYASIYLNTNIICQGKTANFSAYVNQNMQCNYTWYQNGWLVVGTDTSIYQTSPTLAAGSYNYSFVVTNSYGCAVSSGNRSLTVKPTPTVSINAIDTTAICQGDSVMLSATYTPGSTVYWQKNNGSIVGGTDGTLYATILGNYRAIANIFTSGTNCRDTSNIIPVIVHPLPIIGIIPVGSLSFCDGSSVILNATNTIGYNYVWNESGNPIAGATSNSYEAFQGGSYRVSVIDSNGCAKTSLPKVATVIPYPNVTTIALGNTTLCQDDTLLLIANATPGVTYQWKKNNANVGTNDSLVITTSGTYKVVVSNADNCKDTSNSISVMVNPLPTATLTNVGLLTFCEGNSVTLNTNAGTAFNYTWNESGNPIATATSSSYIVSQSGNYSVSVTDSNGCNKTSAAKIVTVNPNPSVTTTYTGSISQGNGLLIADATQDVTYQWQKNNSNIPNGTNNSLPVTLEGSYRVIVTTAESCRDTSEEKLIDKGTLQEDEIINLTIFPNPAQDELTISWESLTDANAKISLTDISGKHVFTHTLQQKPQNTITFLVANLAQGSYLLRIEENNKILTEKVIVKR